MGLLDKLLGRKEPAVPVQEHAVLVYFRIGSSDLSALFAVEEALERRIVEAGVGEFDGNEIAADGSEGTFFMYGPDADALFAAVRGTLEQAPFMSGARIVLRYGPPEDGVREFVITLPSPKS